MACESARSVILALLAERKETASICPSEAARAMARDGEDWRGLMPIVHTSVDEMMGEGLIAIRWKGRPLEEREGPYRISRPSKARNRL